MWSQIDPLKRMPDMQRLPIVSFVFLLRWLLFRVLCRVLLLVGKTRWRERANGVYFGSKDDDRCH